MLLDILKAILLGIVQGVTEWLPVSSTGHLLLIEELLPFSSAVSEPVKNLFTVVIQLGSIMAVLVLYWRRLNPFPRRLPLAERRRMFGLWGRIIVAAIPAAIAGLVFNDVIKEVAYNNRATKFFVIAGALVVYGVLFIVVELLRRGKKPRVSRAEDLSLRDAFGVGCFQALALIPGTSRSGSTILGASLLGVERTAGAEFSFFLAVPMMFGASGLDLVKYVLDFGLSFSLTEVLILAVGTIVAFFVSLAVIRFLVDFVRKHTFAPFGAYRILLAAAVLAYYFLA